MYKVLKAFKCRYQNFKVFREGDEYTSVNDKHTEKLLKLGYIEAVEKSVEKASEKAEKEEAKEVKEEDGQANRNKKKADKK